MRDKNNIDHTIRLSLKIYIYNCLQLKINHDRMKTIYKMKEQFMDTTVSK